MADVSITFDDPGGLLAGLPLFDDTIQAAADYLDRFVTFDGTIDVRVLVETTSTGRFAGTGDQSYVGRVDGYDLWESSLAAEARTGVDPRPGAPDITIFVDPTSSYVGNLWWDPQSATSLGGTVPDGRTDAFSVVLHEMLHGMGVIGWRNIETGALPADYRSVWDSRVSVEGGRAWFDGPATRSLLGEPVEVRLGGSQGAFHLGAGPQLADSTQPWLEASQLNGYYFYYGERYMLGRLELALLQDIGWVLEPTTLVDVVNRWDAREQPRYMVGWDSAEQLAGGALDDRIEGRGGADRLTGHAGNDRLLGGDGSDTLDGGAGNDLLAGGPGADTASYASAAAAVRVSLATTAAQATGGAGSDTLVAIERLVGSAFADRLTGNAGANRIDGGSGADTLRGGAGADQFVLAHRGASDTIADFTSGLDRLLVDQSVFRVGDGDTRVEGAVVRNAPGGFSPLAELVVFRADLPGALDATSAAAAIGSASSGWAAGRKALFVVDNGSASALFLFTSSGSDAEVSAAELTRLATLQGTTSLATTDFIFVA